MKIKCRACGNEQEYNPRENKLPRRPKTICFICGKWIYPFSNSSSHRDKKGNHTSQSRFIIEQYIKRKIDDYNEVVHHCDDKPLNNDINNLFLCSRKLHPIIHHINRILKRNLSKYELAIIFRKTIGVDT